ncbi:MAG: putative metal-binding motif-containing protein [Bacteroidota bacterium]|nr:putative metal-binding motif-containing protein [Bacteroidota bacterium]
MTRNLIPSEAKVMAENIGVRIGIKYNYREDGMLCSFSRPSGWIWIGSDLVWTDGWTSKYLLGSLQVITLYNTQDKNIYLQINTKTDDDGDGFTENDGDCNDNDSSIYPGAIEICGDGIDQDCDGNLICPNDFDNDGDGFTENDGDCNDNDSNIHPIWGSRLPLTLMLQLIINKVCQDHLEFNIRGPVIT